MLVRGNVGNFFFRQLGDQFYLRKRNRENALAVSIQRIVESVNVRFGAKEKRDSSTVACVGFDVLGCRLVKRINIQQKYYVVL